MARAKKQKRYFEVDETLKTYPNATYYFLLGARSCGKTYTCLKKAVKDAIDGNGVFAYVRRYKESINAAGLQDLLSVHSDWVSQYTNGEWNRITYFQRRWWLDRMEVNERTGLLERVARSENPIGMACAMKTWETDKGPDFGADKGGVANIIFDEVISADGDYIQNEWSCFQNVISSFVRDRWEKNTKIWLLANPLSKYGGPYIKNLDIKKSMWAQFGTYEIIYPNEQGERNDDSMSTIFVYIAARTNKEGKTLDVDDTATKVYNKFFAFPNSKGTSKAVTQGYWELQDANLLPSGIYRTSTKKRTVYFHFSEEFFACDVMRYDRTGVYYLFFHPTDKINEYKIPKKDYFVTLGMTLERNGIIGMLTGHPITELLLEIMKENQVYYSDYEMADIFHGFLKEQKMRKI